MAPQKIGEFADLRHALQFEIGGKCGVTAEVSENGERSGSNHCAADGEAIEAVGKIYGVARSDNHEHNESHEWQERRAARDADWRPSARSPGPDGTA